MKIRFIRIFLRKSIRLFYLPPPSLQYLYKEIAKLVGMPGVHPAVHDGVVHGVAHGEPVDDKVDMLDVTIADDGLIKVLDDEVGMLR